MAEISAVDSLITVFWLGLDDEVGRRPHGFRCTRPPLHRSTVLNIRGDSFRLREKRKARAAALGEEVIQQTQIT